MVNIYADLDLITVVVVKKMSRNCADFIRKILSHPAATINNERVFNIAGHIVIIRRCS